MAKIRQYNSFKECFGLQSPFKCEFSGFSIVEYSCFGNVSDIDEKFFECMRLMGVKDNSELELYVLSGGHGNTERLRDYYALWKTVRINHNVSKFNIIHECKINIAGNIRYAGVAKFKTDEICTAIKIVSDYKLNSFIYIKSESRNYSEEELRCFFERASIPSSGEKHYTVINYDYLYNKMNANDIVINVGYDGEEFAVYFIKKIISA